MSRKNLIWSSKIRPVRLYPGVSFCAGPRVYFNLREWKWALFLDALHADVSKNLPELTIFEYVIKTFLDRFSLILIDFSDKYFTTSYMIHNVICDSLLIPDYFYKQYAVLHRSILSI